MESHLFQDKSNLETVLFSRNLITQFAYSKNYDAELIRKGYLINKNYRFGLEREWRLVYKNKDIKYFLLKPDFENIPEYNSKIEGIRYTIEFEDIFEILVESDYQIETIKDLLQKKFGRSNVKLTINSRRHMDDEG